MKTTQEAICRRPVQLEANCFSNPLQPAVEFAGWATSREAAALGQVAYIDQAEAIVDLERKGQTIDLYAVWRKRPVLTSYSDFSISARDCMSSDTVAMLAWTATEKLYYEGDSEPYLTSVLSSGGYVCSSEAFSPNGVDGSDMSAAPCQVVAKLTLEPYGTASCLANQDGYTPTYSVKILDPVPYCEQLSGCYHQPEAVCYEKPQADGTIKTVLAHVYGSDHVYTGTYKRVGLMAQAKVWVAGKSCTYRDKPAEWQKHENKKGCGHYLWQLSGWQSSDGSFFELGSDGKTWVDCVAGKQLSFAPVYTVLPSAWLSTLASDSEAKKYAVQHLGRAADGVEAGAGSSHSYWCPVDGVYAISGLFGTDVQTGKICPPNWETNVGGHLGAAGGFRLVRRASGSYDDYSSGTFADKWTADVGHSSCYTEISAQRGDQIYVETPYTARLSNCTHVTCRAAVDVFPLRTGSAAVSAVSSDSLAGFFSAEEASSRGISQKLELYPQLVYAVTATPTIKQTQAQTYSGSGLIHSTSVSCLASFTVQSGGAYCKIDVSGGSVSDGRKTYSSAIKSIEIAYQAAAGSSKLAIYRLRQSSDFPEAKTIYLTLPDTMAGGTCQVAVVWKAAHAQRNTTSGQWSTLEKLQLSYMSQVDADNASSRS